MTKINDGTWHSQNVTRMNDDEKDDVHYSALQSALVIWNLKEATQSVPFKRSFIEQKF